MATPCSSAAARLISTEAGTISWPMSSPLRMPMRRGWLLFMMGGSLDFDFRALDQVDPELAVLDQERAELLGRRRHGDLRALACQRRLHRGLLHGGDGRVVDLPDDGGRCAGRDEHPVPEFQV